MRRFVGITFAMTISLKNNIKDHWSIQDNGCMVASRLLEKLHMSHSRIAIIRKNWAIAHVQRGSKTFDGIRPIFDMFKEQAAFIFRCGTHVFIVEWQSSEHGKRRPGSSDYFRQ